MVLKCLGFPWNPAGEKEKPKPTTVAMPLPDPAPAIAIPPPPEIPTQEGDHPTAMPRGFYVTLKDLVRFGRTDGCPGCTAMREDKPVKPHSDRCRERILKELGDDPRVIALQRKQVRNRLAITPAGDWRKRYLADIQKKIPDVQVTKYIKHGRWEDDILISDHMEVCGQGSETIPASTALPSIPPRQETHVEQPMQPIQPEDVEMPRQIEEFKRLRSQAAEEDDDESAPKNIQDRRREHAGTEETRTFAHVSVWMLQPY